MRWTVQEIEEHRLCPRLYAFRRVERVDLGPSPAEADGVREALGAAIAAYDATGRPAALWEALRLAWPTGASPTAWGAAVGAAGRRLSAGWRVAAAASVCEVDLGGLALTARADRIDREGAGERLVLYAWGESVRPGGAADRRARLTAAAFRAAGRPIVTAAVEAPETGGGHEAPIGPSEAAALLAEARAVAAAAAADRTFRPRAGPHCARCDHAPLCPAQGYLDAGRAARDLLVLARTLRGGAWTDPRAAGRAAAEAAGVLCGRPVTLHAEGAGPAFGAGLVRLQAEGVPARGAVHAVGGAIDLAPGGDLVLPLGPAGVVVVPAPPVEAEAALALLARTARAAAEAAEARRRARTDHLTGLPNRAAFDEALEALLAAAAPAALLIVDLDRFKSINDTRGHRAGDAALRAAAEVLMAGPCPAYRIGGEEFGVLVPGDAETARAAAEALRSAIAARPVEAADGAAFGVTASIGVGRIGAPPAGDGATASEVLGATDTALYRAKAEGRDRVRTAWDPG